MAGDSGLGIGSAVANIAILAGAAGKGGLRERKRIIELFERIQEPDFDFSELTPPELQLVAEYLPQSYDVAQPDPVAVPEEGPEGRQAQLGALQHFQGVQREGLPLAERLAADEASRAVGMSAQRNQQAIMRDLAARGKLGGGEEISARLAGDDQSAELARGMGSDLARQAVMNRLGAAGSVAQLGGQMRGQDLAASGARANALNNFNQWFVNLRTGAAADAAQSRERAMAANVGNRQRIADTNELSRYSTSLGNLERRNQLQGDLFRARMSRAGGVAQGLEGLGMYRDRQQAARAQSIRSVGEGVDKLGQGALSYFGVGGF